MSYCRFSKGYWLHKHYPQLRGTSLDYFTPKSDVYVYATWSGYQIWITSKVYNGFSYDSPEEVAYKLIELCEKGYTVPCIVIARLFEEQRELDSILP